MRFAISLASAMMALTATPASAVNLTFLPSGNPTITSGQTDRCPFSGPQSNCVSTAPEIGRALGDFSISVPQLNGVFSFGPIPFGVNSNDGVYSLNGSITFDQGSLVSNIINFRYSSTQLGPIVTTTTAIGFYKNVAVFNAATGQILTPVPEAATWAMMILGMGAIGAVMRRRKNKVTTPVQFA
jgi:hypothetical protein